MAHQYEAIHARVWGENVPTCCSVHLRALLSSGSCKSQWSDGEADFGRSSACSVLCSAGNILHMR